MSRVDEKREKKKILVSTFLERRGKFLRVVILHIQVADRRIYRADI